MAGIEFYGHLALFSFSSMCHPYVLYITFQVPISEWVNSHGGGQIIPMSVDW